MAGDSPSILLNILCFLFPVIGAVVYFALQGIAPLRARSAGKATLAGVGFYAVLYGVFILIGFVMMRQMMDMVEHGLDDANSTTTYTVPTATRRPATKHATQRPLPHKPARE